MWWRPGWITLICLLLALPMAWSQTPEQPPERARSKPKPRKKTKKKRRKKSKKRRKKAKKRRRRAKKRRKNTRKKKARKRKTAPAARPKAIPIPKARPLNPGEKIVEAMVKAMGGRETLLAVKKMFGVGSVTAVTRLGDRTARMKFYSIKPGYQRVDQFFGSQVFSLATSPGGGWLRQNGSILNLPRSMIEVTAAESARVDLELRYREEGITVKKMAERTLGGKRFDVILFQDKQSRQTTYYIDQKTHLLFRRTYLGPHPLGQGQVSMSTVQKKYRWVTFTPLPDKKKAGKKKAARKPKKAAKKPKKAAKKPKKAARKPKKAAKKPKKAVKKTWKVRVPFVLESYVGGSKTSSIRFRKIKLNSKDVNKKLFRIPSPVE